MKRLSTHLFGIGAFICAHCVAGFFLTIGYFFWVATWNATDAGAAIEKPLGCVLLLLMVLSAYLEEHYIFMLIQQDATPRVVQQMPTIPTTQPALPWTDDPYDHTEPELPAL